MQIKSFIEPDMRRAMRRVRKTLGPDAVILDTTETENGIEISAAVDYDPAEYERERAARAATASTADWKIESTRDWLDARAEHARSPGTEAEIVNVEISALREEVQNMRVLLESQVSKLACPSTTSAGAPNIRTTSTIAGTSSCSC